MNSIKFIALAIIAFANAIDLESSQSQVHALAELQEQAKEKADCCPCGGERIVIKERSGCGCGCGGAIIRPGFGCGCGCP